MHIVNFFSPTCPLINPSPDFTFCFLVLYDVDVTRGNKKYLFGRLGVINNVFKYFSSALD
jgi:hypothetical protein